MAKHGDIISKKINTYGPENKTHDLTSTHLEAELMKRLQEKEVALQNLEYKYELIEEEKVTQFLATEDDYVRASENIRSKFVDVFESLEQDEVNLNLEIESATMSEDQTFDHVIDSIFDLKNEAYQQFQLMVKASNDLIDDEMRVHTEFIASENEKYNQIQQNYQRLQTAQSNKLLWTIEQSKNALTELNSQLTDKSKNETSFINDSILETLNRLRSTKSTMTSLFKSATDMYTKQRDKINALSLQRQKPHSIVNQTVIHQFVKQIKEVNQKKVNFERLILSELKLSKEMIGKKIIFSDQANDSSSTEKFILQYEIIQKKAEYLLKRNQSMADLLISKYQSEIKKIKIDSFKRVEEIKLAYLMPSMFFQNSINLYSNFAFYVNESFDELDNLLSDLIVFNTRFQDAKIDYISKDAKTMEDYRINLMVRVSNVCSNLTELISKIDHFSKEIITMESQNHLEIAEVRKQMENAEIQGDYDKYIRSVENDHFFAVSQHDSNRSRITNRYEKDYSYIRIQREVALLRQNFELFHAKTAYLKEVSRLEQDIHQIAFEKYLALAKAKFEYDIELNDTKFLMTLEAMKAESNRYTYLYASRYIEEEESLKSKNASGSKEVIDFINHSQKLIDYNRIQTEQIVSEVDSTSSSRTYAYYLEYMRSQIIKAYDEQLQNKIKLNEKATQLIHHPFFIYKTKIETILERYSHLFKQRLLLLDISNIDVLAPYFLGQGLFGYPLIKNFLKVENEVEALLVEFNLVDHKTKFTSLFDVAFENTVINIHESKIALSKKSPKAQVKALNAFLIEQILILKEYQRSVFSQMDEVERMLLENDVIFIQNAKDKAEKTKKMINQEYDRLVYFAVKTDKNRNKQKIELKKDALSVENTFKNEVQSINKTFEDSLEKETNKLAFIKKQIVKLIYQTETKLKKDTLILEKAYHSEQHALQMKSRQYDKAYQEILSAIQGNLDEEYAMIAQMEVREQNNLQASLTALDREMISIPIRYEEKLQLLDDNKTALIAEKKAALLTEYTLIEERKFNTRPELLSKIEEIKKRLPSDYLTMYKNMNKAEEDFLSQYLNITTDYTADFEDFISRQKDSRLLLQNQEFLFEPFQSFISLEDRLLEKNTDAYLDTITKANATKDLLLTEESQAKDKQNRIIND